MKVTFDNIKTGDAIEGPSFSVLPKLPLTAE